MSRDRTDTLPTGDVTFVFTDIEGSTRLLHTARDRYPALLEEHRTLLRSAFQRHSGHEVHVEGDGGLTAFADPDRAVAATLDAQRALITHPWPSDAELRVRMGMNSGRAVIVAGDYVGIAVNAAARICSAAHGSQVLVSNSTRERIAELPPLTELRELGEYRLKDVPEPIRLTQLDHPDLPSRFPPLRTLSVLPNNLPERLTPFVGREPELNAVGRLLQENRLVTLTGPGGCGKTRLAVELGASSVDRYPDGVWLVELVSLTDPDLVAEEVARTLGINEREGASLLEGIVEDLHGKRMLIILDNCEHLRTASAQLADHLLTRCPDLHLIATSRTRLGVRGESVWRVPPLSLPSRRDAAGVDQAMRSDAIRLFCERAAASRPGFELDVANVEPVIEICERLDGLPHALELAAARVGALDCDQIAMRLGDRFRLLERPEGGGPPHHRSLRAVVDWSHALLSDDARVLLRRLAAFAGDLTLDAAERVCTMPPLEGSDVAIVLAELVEQSLLATQDRDTPMRYRLLESVRLFAAEQLVEAGEEDVVRTRHAMWAIELAARERPELAELPEPEWLDLLARELDELRAAIDWSLGADRPDLALKLAGSLDAFWSTRGHLNEGRRRLTAALDAHDGSPTNDRARALASAGSLSADLGDIEEARLLLEECLSVRQQLGEKKGTSDAYARLGNVAFRRSDYTVARQLYEASLEIDRELEDARGLARSYHNLGTIAVLQGQNAAGLALFEKALEARRKLGDQQAIAETLNNLGILARIQGDYEQAREFGRESLEIARTLGHKLLTAAFLGNLGIVALQQNDQDGAQSYYEEALSIKRELGAKDGIATILNSLGNLAFTRGRLAEARCHHAESLTLRRELGDKRGIAESLNNLGYIDRLEGDAEASRSRHTESLEIRRALDDPRGIAHSLAGLAQLEHAMANPARAERLATEALALAVDLGDLAHAATLLEDVAGFANERGLIEDAAKLLGSAQAIRERIGARPIQMAEEEVERLTEAIRETLGSDRFETIWEVGGRLTPKQALAVALDLFAPDDLDPS